MKNTILFTIVLVVIGTAMAIGSVRMPHVPVAPSLPSVQNKSETPDESLAQLLPDTIHTESTQTKNKRAEPADLVPNIGSVQVLNGCGVSGVADRMAEVLRAKNFDVKDIGNAPSWNYPETMIIARNADMGLAREIEKSLKTGNVTLIRNRDGHLYDVTVIVGLDYEKKINK